MKVNKEIIDILLFLAVIEISFILVILIFIRYRQGEILRKAKNEQQECLMKMRSDLKELEDEMMKEIDQN